MPLKHSLKKSKFRSKTQHQFNVTIENYIKAIWNISQSLPKQRKGIKNVELAKHLNVTRASITSMVKKLSEKDLIVRDSNSKDIILSDNGYALANEILRKHRLIEMFLLRTLDLEGLEIHEEAELLEHAISPKLLNAIDANLGFPKYDDSGLIIPRLGKARHSDFKKDTILLSTTQIEDCVTIVSIADYSPTNLDALKTKQIHVGDNFRVIDKSDDNFVHLEGAKKKSIVLSFDEANLIRVESSN